MHREGVTGTKNSQPLNAILKTRSPHPEAFATLGCTPALVRCPSLVLRCTRRHILLVIAEADCNEDDPS